MKGLISSTDFSYRLVKKRYMLSHPQCIALLFTAVTSIVCFAASVQLITILATPSISLFLWTIISIINGNRNRRSRLAQSHLCASVFLPVLVSNLPEATIPFLIGLWQQTLSTFGSANARVLNRQLARSFFAFGMFNVCIVINPTACLWMADFSHIITRLNRCAFESDVVGPKLLHLPLLLFTVIASVPLTGKTLFGLKIGMPIVQMAMVLMLVIMRPLIGTPGLVIGSVMSVSVLITILSLYSESSTIGVCIRPSLPWRAVNLILILVVLGNAEMSFQYPASYLAYSRTTTNSGVPRRILFIDGDLLDDAEQHKTDITDYRNYDRTISLSSFQAARHNPQYSKLSRKLLPALGYDVTVQTLPSLDESELANYDLIVLICIQRVIKESVVKSLLGLVERGATNLLIVGDHTDIGGVQAPFNQIAVPIGMHLNYDSIFPPEKTWHSHLMFPSHPVNGPLAFHRQEELSSIGYSVGASLSIDSRVCFPLLIASDGFADRGTMNARQIAGLGDMRYTINEVRGGHVLAAERPIGRGTVIAFGDTAFLQNGSVTRNFSYIAGLFDYLTTHTKGENVGLKRLVSLAACVCGFVLTLIQFRFVQVACYSLAILGCMLTSSYYLTEQSVIRRFQQPFIVLDKSHSPSFSHDLPASNVSALTDILDLATTAMVIESDAFDILQDHDNALGQRLHGVVMLGEKSALSPNETSSLLAFVARGGRLLCSAGFYERRSCQLWMSQMGCAISSVPIGAGQNIHVNNVQLPGSPLLVEAWDLEIGSEWAVMVTCFERPVVAFRTFGDGRVCIISDAFALLDNQLQGGESNKVDASSFLFYRELFAKMFQ